LQTNKKLKYFHSSSSINLHCCWL